VPKHVVKAKKAAGPLKDKIYDYEHYQEEQEMHNDGLSSMDYASVTKSARRELSAFDRIMMEKQMYTQMQ